ncbi:Crp/Fnr family transcriptional regulator [Variovorax robiniae]|uniref:Crp/Fnr family transcriptional regulator n=1 Tax=Variovorax robiniae TaxID=1836199 RepID=A0ABU8XAV9_9BURK
MPASLNAESSPPLSMVADGPVLSTLPAEAVELLLQRGKRKEWQRGQAIVTHGDTVRAVIVVVEGRVRVSILTSDGDENLLGWLREQELFGLPNVLADMPFSANVVADGPVATLHVAREDFLEILHKVPATAIGVAIALSHRMGTLFEIINASGYRTLAARVRAQLDRIATQFGQKDDGGQVVLDIAQDDLAAAVGASRQRVHIELRKLEDAGVLKLAYRKIILLAPSSPS